MRLALSPCLLSIAADVVVPLSPANIGFSLGINDVIAGPQLVANKNKLIDAAYDVCQGYINDAKRGLLKNAPGSDQEGTLEIKVSGELSGVRAACGNICMAELSKHNAPLIMATCGSKGESARFLHSFRLLLTLNHDP